jgi:hypothetical protein
MAAVLEHRLPDRGPLAELWIDPGVVEAIHPGGDWNDLAESLETDAVTVPTMIYEDHEVEWVDRPQRVFRDKWGALQIGRHDGVPVPTGPPRIETEQDLASYEPPDPAGSPVIDKSNPDYSPGSSSWGRLTFFGKSTHSLGPTRPMVSGSIGWKPSSKAGESGLRRKS